MIDELVRCWILGDKYDIKEFQDLIILELIQSVKGVIVPLTTVKTAFENTPPKSPLRTFMAEEAAWRIKNMSEYQHEDLGIMDGVIGWSAELMQGLDRYKKACHLFGYRGEPAIARDGRGLW